MKAVMYHYVREDSAELPFFKHLHIEDFRKQLDYFGQEFGFVEKTDFLDIFKKAPQSTSAITGELPKGLVLTFDDGFKDHYAHVLPELSKRQLWGIFYVPRDAANRKKLLDPHRVHLLIGKFGGQAVLNELSRTISKRMLCHEHVKEFRTETYKNLSDDAASTEVKRILNYYIGEKYREEALDGLMKAFFEDEGALPADFYLNEKQLREMSEAGMVIGAHTVNHPVMSKLSRAEQRKEIVPCFEYIEKIARTASPRTYCHPYGGSFSFNEDTLDILNELKCAFSFNVEPRDMTADDARNNRQALPRYDCNAFPFGQVRKQQ